MWWLNKSLINRLCQTCLQRFQYTCGVNKMLMVYRKLLHVVLTCFTEVAHFGTKMSGIKNENNLKQICIVVWNCLAKGHCLLPLKTCFKPLKHLYFSHTFNVTILFTYKMVHILSSFYVLSFNHFSIRKEALLTDGPFWKRWSYGTMLLPLWVGLTCLFLSSTNRLGLFVLWYRP